MIDRKLNNQHLNIISFNVPYPADYGGVIDVFYRIRALSEYGIKIHLHCFRYGRKKSEVLSKLCETVTYYDRPRSIEYQFSLLPFIVNTRRDKHLLNNLLNNDYPILFEGLHCCYYLNYPAFTNRFKIVRSHNIEHNYYSGLASKAKTIRERLFFILEASRLKRFESILKNANCILAISDDDYSYLQSRYGKTLLLPPNHPSEEVLTKTGKGNFILYHGDLSTQENTEAALFIINKIVPHIEAQFVFAGKNPSIEIQNTVIQYDNCELIKNPCHERMQQLVIDAHINLLPTFQATGFKLKLLNALFNGRFCVGTPELVAGTGLESYCEVGATGNELIKIIKTKLITPFTSSDLDKRKTLLETHSNRVQITKFLEKTYVLSK